MHAPCEWHFCICGTQSHLSCVVSVLHCKLICSLLNMVAPAFSDCYSFLDFSLLLNLCCQLFSQAESHFIFSCWYFQPFLISVISLSSLQFTAWSIIFFSPFCQISSKDFKNDPCLTLISCCALLIENHLSVSFQSLWQCSYAIFKVIFPKTLHQMLY